MAAGDLTYSYGSFTALTCTLASLADGSGRQTAKFDITAPMFELYVKVTVGTSPTADSLIEIYHTTADDDASELAGGSTGASDAAYSNEKSELTLLGVIKVIATSDKAYIKRFLVEGGSDNRIVVFNETGAAFNATGGNHEVGYRTITPQIEQ